MRFKSVLFFLLINSYVYSSEDILKSDFDNYVKLSNSEKSYDNTINILEHISNVNKIIFDEYAKKIDLDETLAVSQCLNAKAKELVDSYSDCIAVGLTLKKALGLNALELNSIIQKIQDSYPNLAKELKIINSPIPFTKLVSSSKDMIYDIYLNVSNNFLYEKLNYKLPSNTIKKIKDDKRFEKFLLMAISNPKLNFLQSTFLEFDDTNYNYETSFLLGLNRVLNKKYDLKTNIYFENALLKAITQKDKDKANFWLYLLNKDEKSLNALKESNDLNIYTLYIKQQLKEKINFGDDFKVLDYDFLKKYSNYKNILINSFAKTLSSFDENKVSPEFNLGLMQVSLRKAEKLMLLYNLTTKKEELLDPKINIDYFTYILNDLKTDYSHPLMFFYGYINNKEYLNDKLKFDLFKTNSLYAPYLSLELMGNEKAKAFIVSFIAYTKIIDNKELSLEEFFKNLFQPSVSH
jgi:soluble lytic murein transglycosylase|tara:strand:- start:11510 stop:12901 length:1392 start_codon:yes stop_codon:yes gene_type:complete